MFSAFIDADKKSYVKYLKTILGEVSADIVDIDRNAKKSAKSMKIKMDVDIESTVENELNTDENEDDINSFCLLSDGALIIADNTLWKGIVLGQVRCTKYFILFHNLFLGQYFLSYLPLLLLDLSRHLFHFLFFSFNSSF